MHEQRRPLRGGGCPDSPGGYLLFLSPAPWGAADPLRMYGPLLLRGEQPIYAGSAVNLAERERRHLKTLGGAADFDLPRLRILPLVTTSVAAALYVEAVLTAVLRPVFNEPNLSGLGSRCQGALRVRGQRVSAFDCLHRRPWAASPPLGAVVAARLALAAHVVRPRRGPSWSSLPIPDSPNASSSDRVGHVTSSGSCITPSSGGAVSAAALATP